MTPAEILTQCGDDDAPRGCCFQNLDGHMVCRTCAERAIAAAVKAERKACAEIADRVERGVIDDGEHSEAETIRNAIRARGTP